MIRAERIVVRVLAAPLDEPIPMSFSQLTERQMCLVEVHAGGCVGIGESWINYPHWAASERVATLLDGIAPIVLGTDVAEPAVVLEHMVAELGGVGRQWGAPGPIWQAMSAIDLALWDLRGKRTGQSTSGELGAARGAAPAYASGVGPTKVVELTELALSRGIRAVKAKVGFDHDTDRATLATIRSVAPDMQIFADANCAWSHNEAVHQAQVLADEGVEWLEEPLMQGSPAALERLFERTHIPLAAGENAYGLEELVSLGAVPGMAHVQPDPAKSGGITVAAQLAQRLPRTALLSPHWYAGAIGLRASIALATGLQNTGWVELDLRSNPLRDALVSDGFPLDANGHLVAHHGPGLVPDLDPEVVEYLQQSVAERSAP